MHLFHTPTNSAKYTPLQLPLSLTVIRSKKTHHIHLCHMLTAMLIASTYTHRQTQTHKQTHNKKLSPLLFSILYTISLYTDTQAGHTLPKIHNKLTGKQTLRFKGQSEFCMLLLAILTQIAILTTLNQCWFSKGTFGDCVCV